MLRYKCEWCRALIENEDCLSGKQDKCPVCGHSHVVPTARPRLNPATIRNLAIGGGATCLLMIVAFIIHFSQTGGQDQQGKPVLPVPAPVVKHSEVSGQPKASSSPNPDAFYDPSRTHPYKANDVTMCQTREEAIQAIAKQFGRSVAWVESNMGGYSNDLTIIHGNLNKAYVAQQQQPQVATGHVNYSIVSTLKAA